MNYFCERCGKELNVEKEGSKLCLSCQFDFISDKWKDNTNKEKIKTYEQDKKDI